MGHGQGARVGYGGGTRPSSRGAVPSHPEEGEVVAEVYEERLGVGGLGPNFLYVYADGRVISLGWFWNLRFVGERRLTPQGVELVRSGAITAEDLTPFSGGAVPAEVWEDPEIEPFVPSRYAACFMTEDGGGYEPDTALPFFPAPARAILRGEPTYGSVDLPDSRDPGCSQVTTDEARTLTDILADVRMEDAGGSEISVILRMILPHGVHIGRCAPVPELLCDAYA